MSQAIGHRPEARAGMRSACESRRDSSFLYSQIRCIPTGNSSRSDETSVAPGFSRGLGALADYRRRFSGATTPEPLAL
jgi:hypothetical protein